MQIILIPGLMNDAWVWRLQAGPLSRIAPVTVANNDGCDSLGAMAERILALSHGPLAVVGHSRGSTRDAWYVGPSQGWPDHRRTSLVDGPTE